MKAKPSDLATWLRYISEQHPEEIELGLGRLRDVADRLGIRGFDCPVITVAGTNGKGSSIAMLESIYSAAGYTTGAYTSPHLTVFNERIRVAGRFCSDQKLCRAFQCIEDHREGIPLTYFEYATLAAYIVFSAASPDVLLLEVGLGGRLDAVNLFAPDVALITRVGIDHTAWLGEDREAIGREKAGIIHPSSIAVIADPEPPVSVLTTADQKAISSYFLHRHFGYASGQDRWTWHLAEQHLAGLPFPPMAGGAQLDNAAGVLMAVQALQDRLNVSEGDIRQGLAKTQIAGRYQVAGNDPVIVLDVAHNEESAALLAENLARQPVSGRTLAVFGMLADKDIDATIARLSASIDAWYVGGLDAARGASAASLARRLTEKHVKHVQQYASIEQAWQDAKAVADKGDRLVVFGSFHTVGAILEQLSRPETSSAATS